MVPMTMKGVLLPHFLTQLALGVVRELAEEGEHEKGEQVVKAHDETAHGVGKTVGVLEEQRHDEVVRRPEYHDDGKCETDLESLRVVEPKRFFRFAVVALRYFGLARCGVFLDGKSVLGNAVDVVVHKILLTQTGRA